MADYYIGIDPGVTGAMALISVSYRSSELLELWDLPYVNVGKRNRKAPNEDEMLKLMRYVSSAVLKPTVVLEQVDAIGRQSSTAMFTFGGTYYCIRTALRAAGLDFHSVTSPVWKKAMGLDRLKSNERKKKAREMAGKLFPGWEFDRSDSADCAEAALLAEYGRRSLK